MWNPVGFMGSKKDSSAPNNSQAMIDMAQQSAMAQRYASDNQYQLGMAEIGAQMIQAQGMFNLGQAQINAQRELASERNQTSLDIARLNYLQQAASQEDRHEEKMGEIDLRRYEIDHPSEALGL